MNAGHARLGECVFCASRARLLHPGLSPWTTPRRASSQASLTAGHFPKGDVPNVRRVRARPDETVCPSPLTTSTLHVPVARRPTLRGRSTLKLNIGKLQRGTAEEPLKRIIRARLDHLTSDPDDSVWRQSLGLDHAHYVAAFRDFRDHVIAGALKERQESTRPSLETLSNAYIDAGEDGIDMELRYAFFARVVEANFTESDTHNQAKLADLRYPLEWFPATRAIQRTIHLHVGPTNSGKTYHALKKLEEAKSGVYAGPLRLLAHEVYARLNAKGIPCDLVTGDERKTAEGAEQAAMSSCTVEMVPLNVELDVAVIDEIQMIGSADRGWAWTQALLGLKAKELHLCGEERTVPLIRDLATAMGDKLEIHQYQRLSPLQTMTRSLKGDLKALEKGDCIVVFSRLGIHAMKKDIERMTGKRCAVVYGSLPPETRAQQARLFSDPNNDYDFLVASDAIGMGLNLSIKRIIFESTQRNNGMEFKTLEVADIKQIAGRAGRYRTAQQATSSEEDSTTDETSGLETSALSALTISAPASKSVGYVTTLEKADLPIVQHAMSSNADIITSAGIFPPASVLQRFATYFPEHTPFSYVLIRLHELSQIHARFHLCALKDHLAVADIIQPIPDLSIADRTTLCASPASLRDPRGPKTLLAFAKCVARQSGGDLLDIPELDLDVLDQDATGGGGSSGESNNSSSGGNIKRASLQPLESLHKGLMLYLWLSYRFAGVFTSRALAFHVKALTEAKIDEALAAFAFDQKARHRIKRVRRQAVIDSLKREIRIEGTGVGLGGKGLGGGVKDVDEPSTASSVPPDLALPVKWSLEKTGAVA